VVSALFLAVTQTALFLVREFGVVPASPTFSSEFFVGVRVTWMVFLWALVPGAFRLESLRRTNPRGDPALIGRGRRSAVSATRQRALDRAGEGPSRSHRTWLIPGALAALGFAALIAASRTASPIAAFDAFETAWTRRGTDAVAALVPGDRRERVAAALARLDEREGWSTSSRPPLGPRREVIRHEQALVYHPFREAAERTLRTAWVRRGDAWLLIQCRVYPKGEVPDDGADDASGR
jgi:hypothetical protein